MDIARLVTAIEDAWSRDTSADPDAWRDDNPAWGQCAVTALIVQDHLGGVLLRTTVDGISHYFNRLPDGRPFDLTRIQFGPNPVLDEIAERERDYVLSFEPTRQRYLLLKQRVAMNLNRP